MTIPGQKSQMDYPHLASLASPKPMLFFNGKTDPLFPQNVVEEANETMANVWNESNAADKIEIKSFDCAHFCSKEMIDKVILFFNRNLKK